MSTPSTNKINIFVTNFDYIAHITQNEIGFLLQYRDRFDKVKRWSRIGTKIFDANKDRITVE